MSQMDGNAGDFEDADSDSELQTDATDTFGYTNGGGPGAVTVQPVVRPVAVISHPASGSTVGSASTSPGQTGGTVAARGTVQQRGSSGNAETLIVIAAAIVFVWYLSS